MESIQRVTQQFPLRLPVELHEALQERAWRERKSLNQFLVEMARQHIAEKAQAQG